jgi:sec-independent protein translocase protein TatA
MPNLGPTELIIILLIVVLLFGARKIPEIAKGLGKGIRDFKSAVKDGEDDETKALKKPDSENRPSA